MEPMDLQQTDVQAPVHGPAIPAEPAPTIHSRFLFVDIAAMRAKQLRRGALPRFNHDDVEAHRPEPHKAERVAMEEVRRGLVLYETPDLPGAGRES